MAYNDSHVSFFFFFFFVVMFSCTFSVAQMVPALFVFGDSLVDVGNNNYLKLSLLKANFPHNGIDFPGKKPTGRFSNGKNSADFLAEKLGLPTSPPYLSLVSKSNKSNVFLTGVSFASGGAGIFNDTNKNQAIPLNEQVDYYSTVYADLVKQLGSAGAQNHLSKSLFYIVIGSNDIFVYFSEGSDLRNKSTPQQYVDLMALTLKEQLKIYNFGARKFVLAGLGPVGCCPSQRFQDKTDECNEEENYWSNKYNEGLMLMLQELKSELENINYTYFDSYSLLLNVIQEPAAYGFTEVKAACCGLGYQNAKVGCLPISTYCANRTNHAFWDPNHPSEAAARRYADTSFDGPEQYSFPMNVKKLAAAL